MSYKHSGTADWRTAMIINEENKPTNKPTINSEGIRLKYNPENGLITELYFDKCKHNLVGANELGGARFTLNGESIETNSPFTAYSDNYTSYNKIIQSPTSVVCKNTFLRIQTEFSLDKNILKIKTSTDNGNITRIGTDLNFNFLGTKNGSCFGQLLPTSPYTSSLGNLSYCIMSVFGEGFCAVVSETDGAMWKTDYSPYSFGHFINGFQFLKTDSENCGTLDIECAVFFSETEEECLAKIADYFSLPMVKPQITGAFSDTLTADIIGKCDRIEVTAGERKEILFPDSNKIAIRKLCYGRHKVTPFIGCKAGLDCEVWFGGEAVELFEKSCDSLKKPYHGDDNLCEGGMWCLSLLCFMNYTGNTKYLDKVKSELRIIMGESREIVPRRTILPYSANGYPAYHIYKSKRIQEQFFGVSILCEAFKLTRNGKYLDFAVNSSKTVIENYMRPDGAIAVESDYTTVCAPIIPIIDLALILKEEGNGELYGYFAKASSKIVNYLLSRGMHFPTEGIKSDLHDEELEEGSISCTALSLLYYCRYIEKRDDYIEFAEKVLSFHENFICRTPDVKLYRSTVRWWETIWEGDGTGPAICAGHAWSIWRAEADFHMAVLTGNHDYYIKSLNGFMTNFSKIAHNGHSFACYQPDFFSGGGDCEIRKSLKHLSSADIPKKYGISKGYPHHFDNSLSRYVWCRACATWLEHGFSVPSNPKELNL